MKKFIGKLIKSYKQFCSDLGIENKSYKQFCSDLDIEDKSCKQFGSDVEIENHGIPNVAYRDMEAFIDDWLAKQAQRALAQSDQLQMLNAYYVEQHKKPWIAYIELSDIVIMFEDFEKIIEYIGLKDVLFARSNENKKFELLPQLKIIQVWDYRWYGKFFIFACGDFYIACILGSRHILVLDQKTYDTYAYNTSDSSAYVDSSFPEIVNSRKFRNRCRASYIHPRTPYVPYGGFKEVYLLHNHFDIQFDCTSRIYKIDFEIRSEELCYKISTASVNKATFIALAKKLRKKFFSYEKVWEDYDETSLFWDTNRLKFGYKKANKLLTLKVKIPEDMLTC